MYRQEICDATNDWEVILVECLKVFFCSHDMPILQGSLNPLHPFKFDAGRIFRPMELIVNIYFYNCMGPKILSVPYNAGADPQT